MEPLFDELTEDVRALEYFVKSLCTLLLQELPRERTVAIVKEVKEHFDLLQVEAMKRGTQDQINFKVFSMISRSGMHLEEVAENLKIDLETKSRD